MQFKAEVSHRLQGERSCQGLLYAPLSAQLTYRETRVYTFDYEGDEAELTAFVKRVLFDEVSQELNLQPRPAFSGYRFFLDYGMKPSALDLEKETILRFHRSGGQEQGFTINALTIVKRLYIFGEAGHEASPEPFIKDIVNPAIHIWRVTDAQISA